MAAEKEAQQDGPGTADVAASSPSSSPTKGAAPKERSASWFGSSEGQIIAGRYQMFSVVPVQLQVVVRRACGMARPASLVQAGATGFWSYLLKICMQSQEVVLAGIRELVRSYCGGHTWPLLQISDRRWQKKGLCDVKHCMC